MKKTRKSSGGSGDAAVKKEEAPRGPQNLEALVTIERTMQVFEMLADRVDGLPVSEIARVLGVNKSIAFRIIATLRTAGYTYQNLQDQTYRLTYRISNLGLRQQANARLTDQCFPVVRALADETGELIRLAVIEAGVPVWIHAASGPQRRLRIDPVWQAKVIFSTHAAGKAYLSTLSDSEIAAKLGPEPYVAQTRYSKTTLGQVMKDVRLARKSRFALSFEESELGVGAIATPIMKQHDHQNSCVAVLSIAAPTSRMDRDTLLAAGEALLRSRHQLELAWPLDPNILT